MLQYMEDLDSLATFTEFLLLSISILIHFYENIYKMGNILNHASAQRASSPKKPLKIFGTVM